MPKNSPPPTPNYYYQVYAYDNETPCPVADAITEAGIQDRIIDHRDRANCCIGQGCMRLFARYMYDVNRRMARQDEEWAKDSLVAEPGSREGLVMSVEAILEDPRFMCKRGKTCPLIEPALKDKMETQGSIDPTDMVYEQYGYCKEHGYPPEFASDVEDADAQWAEDYGDLPALSKLFRLNPTIADGMKERAAEIFKTEEE